MKKKMFDFVIGNPPYQEEFSSDGNKTYAAPVYNIFMEAAYQVANSAELIHPARFLFNAGSTPKDWNRKMLEDPHFKVLSYEEDATQVFPNTDIKGGVAVTFHDLSKNFGAIQVFTKYPELNSILRKVGKSTNMCGIVISRTAYRLTDKMHKDQPEALAQLTAGHPYDMATNIFEILPQIFFDLEPKDSNEYIQILGRTKSGRLYKFVRRDYVNNVINLDCYKVFLPSANGNGNYGEILSHPLIALPGTGSTETFISIGTFDSQNEAENCLKYIKSSFARGLLGVLKSTQHLTPDKWAYVPLQDFTSNSDIDWTQSITEIDQQLYKKYGLSQEEIDFIETHVKEMN